VLGDKREAARELLRQYRGHMDPIDAVRGMREKGYGVDDVRAAIQTLVDWNSIEYQEARWMEGAVNMLSFPTARTNPASLDTRPTMFKHFEEHIEEVQDEIRAALLGLPRTNPSSRSKEGGQADLAMNAFFQPKSYASSYKQGTQWNESGYRDVVEYNKVTHESFYKLWDNTIAELLRGSPGKENEWRLELDDAGYSTPTTMRRLENIIRIGAKYHPEIAKSRYGFSILKGETQAWKDGKPWKRDPKSNMWTIKLKPISMFDVKEASVEKERSPLKLARSRLNTVEQRIDEIEKEMNIWQVHNDPARKLDYSALADRVGKRDELSKLLRERMSLIGSERTNPESNVSYWSD
jgi:hypothetical protein